MVIQKVINNNVISAYDENQQEVVIMGKGIGFKAHTGDAIDESRVEKVFRIENEKLSRQFQEILENIPLEHMQLTSDIITYAKKNLNVQLNQSIYITLTDHINFAIQRQVQGIQLKNALLWEIKKFYHQEYLMGKYAINLLNEKLGTKFSEDEAGFIALHFVNAEYDTTINDTFAMTNMIQGILELVKQEMGIEFDEESLHYERFVTHLKFLAQRLYRHELLKDEEIEFAKLMENKYPGEYECSKHIAEYINNIGSGLDAAVENSVKNERMKTELITNVSHDLKTPLTAIITYVKLLQEPGVTQEQRKEYLETLDRKALRLKALIEDLFEVSKANSRNITLDIRDVDIVSMVKQVEFEMEDKLTDAGLEVRMSLPEEKVIVPLDSQKTFRIFENLFGNIAKYALPGTRVYVNGFTAKEDVTIILKNITAQELSVSGEELTERFVRGDTSRNTEGSGLGLAIAKSFTELQSGKFRIELDGDLFKVVLTWKVKSQNGQNMVPRESETAEKNENSDCLS